MRIKNLIYILLAGMIFVLFSCSEDIGIKDFTFQCETDKDCKDGYVCDKTKGCIKLVRDAGTDAVTDVMQDVTDTATDTEDIADISDAEDIQDIEDTGGVEEISDITDGGTDVQVNYILRIESVYDSSAGICTSPNYVLESVTGFTASEEMRNSQYILHRNVLFKK